mmetsp:Transcript_12907/g.35719  ORF Transcript_12907/g.35719 Transcript_12907/m.35719 type:complete len:139 (-) Transcript_12907:769-1185(-)
MWLQDPSHFATFHCRRTSSWQIATSMCSFREDKTGLISQNSLNSTTDHSRETYISDHRCHPKSTVRMFSDVRRSQFHPSTVGQWKAQEERPVNNDRKFVKILKRLVEHATDCCILRIAYVGGGHLSKVREQQSKEKPS